jgi:hypothetical protein
MGEKERERGEGDWSKERRGEEREESWLSWYS